MPKASADPVQKRLHILSPSEVEALFARPVFTPDERLQAFTLTPAEKSMLSMFSRLHIQVAFILELGYFKAKQRFFSISFAAVTDDLQAILAQHFPRATLAKLRPITKPTRIKIRRAILNLQQHQLCGITERTALALRARQAAQISSKPIYVFREVFRYLSEQRWVAPGYTVLQDLVSQAITDEYERLTAIFKQHLTPADCAVFDELFAETEGLYPLTRLKHDPRDFSRSEMRQERARADQLRPLYAIAQRVLPHLGISAEGMKYYASLVSYYTVFRLRQFDEWTIYLYLVCFVVDRYHRLHDHLLTCLITTVKHVVDTAKEAAKEQVYHHRLARNADLPKAGRILKLFTTNHPPDVLASTIQDHAFAILERSRIEQVAEYLTTNARFDEVAFQWDHIQTMSQRFKPPLRPILRLVEFASLRLHDPVLEAVCFLKQVWDQNRRLSQVNPDAIPMRFIPKHLRRYLYQVTTDGTKQIIPDRYEFLLYRLLRNGLESGDLFCRTSNRFQSFEDDLIDATVWQEQKAALLQETGGRCWVSHSIMPTSSVAIGDAVHNVQTRRVVVAAHQAVYPTTNQSREQDWSPLQSAVVANAFVACHDSD
ncbi:DUF4158 domain-containing protein [Herpetosiphon gulosus]|uniref:DUF4158 domain-containing protein n=1 Tax=Herpetosiphon gulosus TaxID=1973496 RepID=A0ABP9X9M6_9CHLR